jgi:hypothetical protein
MLMLPFLPRISAATVLFVTTCRFLRADRAIAPAAASTVVPGVMKIDVPEVMSAATAAAMRSFSAACAACRCAYWAVAS